MKPQKQRLENLLNILAAHSMSYHEFVSKFSDIEELTDGIDVKNIELWRTLGLDIVKNEQNEIELQTRFRDITQQEFCIVDIETSGGITSGQIIEIGALKIKNGVEIGRFESFVDAPFVPENITQLTGISQSDLTGAPSLKSVLERFKIFLGTSVFVAHNVNFDYGFISQSLSNIGLGMLLNRKLCTIDLSRRTIASQKYGLGSLKELLGINNTHHRALNDAIAATEILKICISRLPFSIQSVEDLINFSKTAPSMKLKPEPSLQNSDAIADEN
ncbi:3'-5' exonuclease [Campylobacter curvus]|uniref:DNA polymerase III, epsilon subunit n=1 Tax=Campylobacter curvus (strain 525.92) TaxID=360105 RepID=A7GZ66_CAMC5|nr:3'-5' exonuclease [Campylobacter curvus]EAU00395.1 DNA polymerase III, epsilon subunit [Campylobacter curvus 525.92]